jgi:opacity protein-like surface antigen
VAESAPFSDAHDGVGFTLGANLNRYFGLELAVDSYELFVQPPGLGDIGELGIMTVIPQVRLRYPLLNDRLVPYAAAGIGVGFSQFNDAKQDGLSLTISDSIGSVVVGSAGAGLEYFIADNIAVGVEAKYLFSGPTSVNIQGFSPYRMNLNAGLASVQVRIFYPELHPPAAFTESGQPTSKRFYVALRGGGALPTQKQPFAGIQYMAGTSAWFNALNPYFGASAGYNFTRYFGLELAGEGYEMRLALPPGNQGALGDYAVHAFTIQSRLRYPMLEGRLEPYLVGGAGVGFAQFNDKNAGGQNIQVKAENFAPVGTIGTGVDYFIVSNIAVNVEAKYLIARGFTAQLNNGPQQTGNLDTVFLSFGLRLYLF